MRLCLSAYARVIEENRGLNTSVSYYFVIDGNKLVHISRYAVSSKERVDRHDLIEHIVDLNKLKGKSIAEVSGSKASGLRDYLYVFPSEYLENHYENAFQLPFSYLNNLEFTYLTQEDREFLLGDWTRYYTPMIKQLQTLFSLSNVFIYPQHLLYLQLKSGTNYPLPFLVPYPDGRKRALGSLTKEIHQIWITIRIVMELNTFNVIKNFNSIFKQSPSYPVAIFDCSCGDCSLWYEFDINPFTMFDGAGWREKEIPNSLKEFYERDSKIPKSKRHSSRPDIAILCNVNNYKDFHKVNKVGVRALIECKNTDIQHWRKDINDQILPYKQIFQPDIIIVASLKKVPESVKAQLNQQGIRIIDEVYPGGKGEKELLEIIKLV